MNNYQAGILGQQAAEDFLLRRGFQILDRNYRIKTGEIDLIAKDGDCITFIEVKYRSSLRYGYPSESVGYKKQRRVIEVAMQYLSRHGLEDCDVRFDVTQVLLVSGKLYISHIENAFTA